MSQKDDAQRCAVCGKVEYVPETTQENMCTVEVTHHYGSDKDGTTEAFDVCLACIKRVLKAKPKHVVEHW